MPLFNLQKHTNYTRNYLYKWPFELIGSIFKRNTCWKLVYQLDLYLLRVLDVLKGHDDVIAGCLNQTIDEIWNCGTSRCLGWSTSLTNLFLNQFSTSKET